MRSISVLSVRRLALALVAAGAVGVVLTLVGVRTPLQTLLLLLFLALAPAMAVAGLLRSPDKFARLLMAATATIVINCVVAEMTLATGGWSSRTQVISIVLITAAVTVVQLPRVRAAASRLSVRRAGARAAEPYCVTRATEPDGSEPVAEALRESPAQQARTFAEIWAAFADLKQALGLPIEDGYPGADHILPHPVHPRNPALIGPSDIQVPDGDLRQAGRKDHDSCGQGDMR